MGLTRIVTYYQPFMDTIDILKIDFACCCWPRNSSWLHFASFDWFDEALTSKEHVGGLFVFCHACVDAVALVTNVLSSNRRVNWSKPRVSPTQQKPCGRFLMGWFSGFDGLDQTGEQA